MGKRGVNRVSASKPLYTHHSADSCSRVPDLDEGVGVVVVEAMVEEVANAQFA